MAVQGWVWEIFDGRRVWPIFASLIKLLVRGEMTNSITFLYRFLIILRPQISMFSKVLIYLYLINLRAAGKIDWNFIQSAYTWMRVFLTWLIAAKISTAKISTPKFGPDIDNFERFKPLIKQSEPSVQHQKPLRSTQFFCFELSGVLIWGFFGVEHSSTKYVSKKIVFFVESIKQSN